MTIRVPTCSKCARSSILHQAYSGQDLCRAHLLESVRKRVARELRAQVRIPDHHDPTNPFRILVAVSGGKDSSVLLERMVDLLGPRQDVELLAACVDEGIEGYRTPSLESARALCARLGVPFHTVTYPELGFREMDEVVRRLPMIGKEHSEASGLAPCSFCGVFRRRGLQYLARSTGAHLLAFGHNLDDMAQTVMMNLQKGDVRRTLRMAPHTNREVPGLIPRIVPLRFIPEQEIMAYAKEIGLEIHHDECPHAEGALRWRHRSRIAQMESEVPGTRQGLVRFVDGLRAMIEDTPTGPDAVPCPQCGSMGSGTSVCRACEMRGWITQDDR